MSNNKLYIIAAGLASRMGGYPKHLCVIDNNGTTNIEHTLSLAKDKYDEIIIVLNKMLASEYAVQTISIAEKYGAKIKFIDSGKGDGHAVYSALENETQGRITCVWGDTYFNGSLPKITVFPKILTIVCSKEVSPYCYIYIDKFNKPFEQNNLDIDAMYFKSDYPISDNEKMLHDQSTFIINVEQFKYLFKEYMNYCDFITKTFIKSKDIEYSIIKFVNWCKRIYNYEQVEAYILPERPASNPYTISFNTKEELQKVVNLNNK